MKNSILYSPVPDSDFHRYVGIGGSDIDPQEPESYIFPDDQSLEGWKEFLDYEDSINPIVAMNYILIFDDPESYLPQEILNNFLQNKSDIETIVSNWFTPNSALFEYLDLICFYFEDEKEEVVELNEEETKYRFKDGSSIIINENETSSFQYFIPTEKLHDLRNDNNNLKNFLLKTNY